MDSAQLVMPAAIVTVPLAVEILERVFAVPLEASARSIARVVFVMVLLPFVAGLAVHAAAPPIADRLEKWDVLLAKVLMPIAILALLAGTWRAIWAAIGDGTVVAIVAFVVGGLLVGHLLGGPDLENSVVLALSSACRHPAIALSIAAAKLSGRTFWRHDPSVFDCEHVDRLAISCVVSYTAESRWPRMMGRHQDVNVRACRRHEHDNYRTNRRRAWRKSAGAAAISDMMWIPGGTFRMGSDKHYPAERSSSS